MRVLKNSLYFLLVLLLILSGCARTDFVRNDLLDIFNEELKESNDDIIYLQLKAIKLDSVLFDYRLRVREAMNSDDIQLILQDMVVPFIHSKESNLEHENVINNFGLKDGIYRITVEIYLGPKSELKYMTYDHFVIDNIYTWIDSDHDRRIEYID